MREPKRLRINQGINHWHSRTLQSLERAPSSRASKTLDIPECDSHLIRSCQLSKTCDETIIFHSPKMIAPIERSRLKLHPETRGDVLDSQELTAFEHRNRRDSHKSVASLCSGSGRADLSSALARTTVQL